MWSGEARGDLPTGDIDEIEEWRGGEEDFELVRGTGRYRRANWSARSDWKLVHRRGEVHIVCTVDEMVHARILPAVGL